MPERTLHNRSLASSTRSRLAWLAIALACSGCSRQPARTARGVTINGYVHVETLMASHPGWREVEELNSALNAAELAKPAAASGEPLAPKAYPPPLDAKGGVPRTTAVDESQRIEAIRDPALARIERLKGTSGLRMERNISRNQADVEKNVKARLAENAQKLAQQNTDEKAAIRKAAHANIRDLGLREIALGSE